MCPLKQPQEGTIRENKRGKLFLSPYITPRGDVTRNGHGRKVPPVSTQKLSPKIRYRRAIKFKGEYSTPCPCARPLCAQRRFGRKALVQLPNKLLRKQMSKLLPIDPGVVELHKRITPQFTSVLRFAVSSIHTPLPDEFRRYGGLHTRKSTTQET